MRKFFLVGLGLTLLLLLGYAGFLSYSKSKETRLMTMARKFIAQSDEPNAVLCLKEVLQINPRNVAATRLMADLAEKNGQANALLWRSRVVELNPNSSADRVALASAAVMAGDFALATNSLAHVGNTYQKSAVYQNDAGILAINSHQPALAESYFREAALLDPNGLAPQLNYAILRLHSTNEQAVAEARGMLEQVAKGTNAVFRCQALRELTADAYVHRHYDVALSYSKRLLDETNSFFSDRILQLDVLKKADPQVFEKALSACEAAAGVDPVKIYELATWEINNTQPGPVLTWISSLPPDIQTNQPVTLLSAECRVLTEDWPGLVNSLKKQDWGTIEFIRHAFLARAMFGQQLTDGKAAEWGKALNAAGTDLKSLSALYQLATQWGWTKEKDDLLAQIIQQYPQQKWASLLLLNDLVAAGRTDGVMLLSAQMLQQNPNDIQAKNNLAMTALLLNKPEQEPFKLAHQVYMASPTNISFASTYAFSLYLQKKNEDALRIFEQFSPKDFQDPETAGYYGLVLKAAGHPRKAKFYLDQAIQSPSLLPEERKLFGGIH